MLRKALLLALLCLPACAQKIAGTGATGPNGAAIGRNGSTNWLYLPADSSGNLYVDTGTFGGTPQVAGTGATGPLGSLIGYYAAGSEWLYVPVDSSGKLMVNCGACAATSGTVTTVSVATANGISGTVANPTTTPAITLSLGAINPSSVGATTPGTGAFTTGTFGGTISGNTFTLNNLSAIASSWTLDVTSPSTALADLGGAPLASPALTGTPTVPTATVGTNTTQAASTAFVLANASAASATYFSQWIGGTNIGMDASANTIIGFGFVPPINVTFSHIYLTAITVDATGLYSASIANSSGTLVCHLTTGINMPANATLMTNACSEGSVTLTAGATYILLITGNATTARVSGGANNAFNGPYYNTGVSGCTSSSGVISGTCSITLSMAVYAGGPPMFTLH